MHEDHIDGQEDRRDPLAEISMLISATGGGAVLGAAIGDAVGAVAGAFFGAGVVVWSRIGHGAGR